MKKRTIWAGLLSFPVVVMGMFFMKRSGANYLMMVLSAPVMFWLGWFFLSMLQNKPAMAQPIWTRWWPFSTGIAFLFSAFIPFRVKEIIFK